MKIKYRHAAEPECAKVFNTNVEYRSYVMIGHSGKDITLEEYNMLQLKRFAEDKEKGLILDFEVISEAEAEKLLKRAIFDLYKDGLLRQFQQGGLFHFKDIEYLCRLGEIEPVKMAVELRKEGYMIIFDDSSIPRGQNVKKRKIVENAFQNAMKEGLVDRLISDSTAAAKGVNQVKEAVGKDYVK